MIQELLVINYPDFVRHAWVSSCIYWAILSIGYIANVWGYRVLPMIEKLAMVLHIAFFFVIFIVALVLPPERKSAAFVFTTSSTEADGKKTALPGFWVS
jgi:choline transport protein